MSTAVVEPARSRAHAYWRELDARTRWSLAVATLAALGFAAGVYIIDATPVGVFADDAMYVILARSVASGQGFRVLNLPGAPFAAHFPPGYPLMLSVLWRLAPRFPDNVMLFKAFNAICLALVAVGIARYMRDRLDTPRLAVAVGAVTAVSVPLLCLGTMVISEMSFLALLLLLLPAMERFTEARAPLWKAIVLGVVIGICALIRTHGIVLAPAVAFVLLCRGRWRDAAAVVVATVVTMLPWQLWSAHNGAAFAGGPLLGTYGSYGAWWRQGYEALGPAIFPLTLARTLPETHAAFAVLFSPIHDAAALAATMVLLLATVAATVRAHWRRIPVTLLFLLGYVVILELWPGPPTRMLWGLWPLFLMLFAVGGREILRASSQRTALTRVAAAAAMVWLCAGYAVYEWRGVRGQWWALRPSGTGTQILGLVAWTRRYTRPEDIVATDAEGAVFLYTGRRTVPVRAFTTDDFLAEPVAAVEARRGLVPILSTYPVRAVLVGSAASLDAATLLTAPPHPKLAPAGVFHWGAAFTVVGR
jgi:hypothetical protein